MQVAHQIYSKPVTPEVECEVTAAVAMALRDAVERLLPELSGAEAAELQELSRLIPAIDNKHEGRVRLPFHLAVTPYLICTWPINDPAAGDHIYLQRHHKSGLLVPIGGGKLDPEDRSIHSGMLREFFEEADTLPWYNPIFGTAKTDVFDIGLIRGASGNLGMVDIRRAFRVCSSSVGRVLSYNEKPKDGQMRGDDAVLIPLNELIAWKNRRGNDAFTVSARATVDGHVQEDLIKLSNEAAATALRIDPCYFRRFERLARRLQNAEQAGGVGSEWHRELEKPDLNHL